MAPHWTEAAFPGVLRLLKGEETIYFQIPCSGSCYTSLFRVNCPAVDALERYPGNHYYPRIASSLSRQFGDGQCLAEALGGSGWGLKPEDVENYVDWLAESGINCFAFHLWQYERNSASIRDWPPNIPWGMTWKQVMQPLLQRLKERWDNRFLQQQNHCLLAAPVRGCMAEFIPEHAQVLNEHNGDGTPNDKSGKISRQFSAFAESLYASGMEYDVTEERLMEQKAVLENGKLRLGNILYDCVIAGDGCLWESDLPELLKEKGLWHEAKEFHWRFSGITSGMNQLPLEWSKRTAEIRYSSRNCSFLKDCRLRILDRVSCVKANGIILQGQRTEDGIFFPLNEEVVQSGKAGCLLISFEPEEGGEQRPFAFLEGSFLVKNSGPYEEIDHRQLRSTGFFYLEAPDHTDDVNCRDLITAGFPFCRSGACLSARRYIDPQGRLRIPEVNADCAFVKIQGKAAGAVWGPEWVLDTGLPEGIYDVELELIPSTFNTYGPHHHRDGDRPLISPDQYSGIKNFADHPEAPSCTLISEWYLVKWGISE